MKRLWCYGIPTDVISFEDRTQLAVGWPIHVSLPLPPFPPTPPPFESSWGLSEPIVEGQLFPNFGSHSRTPKAGVQWEYCGRCGRATPSYRIRFQQGVRSCQFCLDDMTSYTRVNRIAEVLGSKIEEGVDDRFIHEVLTDPFEEVL